MSKRELQEKLLADIREKFGDQVTKAEIDNWGEPVVYLDPAFMWTCPPG